MGWLGRWVQPDSKMQLPRGPSVPAVLLLAGLQVVALQVHLSPWGLCRGLDQILLAAPRALQARRRPYHHHRHLRHHHLFLVLVLAGHLARERVQCPGNRGAPVLRPWQSRPTGGGS